MTLQLTAKLGYLLLLCPPISLPTITSAPDTQSPAIYVCPHEPIPVYISPPSCFPDDLPRSFGLGEWSIFSARGGSRDCCIAVRGILCR